VNELSRRRLETDPVEVAKGLEQQAEASRERANVPSMVSISGRDWAKTLVLVAVVGGGAIAFVIWLIFNVFAQTCSASCG
jgi:hypothetical protein